MTNKAFKTVLKKRPFIIVRSNSIGSGVHAPHLTEDYDSTWDDLHCSIPEMLNFGLFGVPMVDADVCGFAKNTTEELCNRWIQLGSFYPFTRDHSAKNTIRRELFLWKSVTKSARKSLGLRYRLLPYLYTLSFEAHTKGSPIARPLFFTFPNDTNTLDISTQFLLGKGVLVSPVLNKGARTVDAYFPKGTWYSLFNVSKSISVESGSYVKLQAPLDTINVHVYEGTILPMQEMGMTTREARKSPFSLVVAMGSKMEATGDLYLDDGERLNMKLKSGKSSHMEFSAKVVEGGIRITSEVQKGKYAIKEGWVLHKVTVLGLKSSSNSCVRGVSSATVHGDGVDERKIKVEDIKDVKSVMISNLSLPIGKNIDLSITCQT